MSLILIAFITFIGILLGKLLFKKWFNHLTLYCVIMGGLIFFYELKLLPYPDIIPLAWFMLVSSLPEIYILKIDKLILQKFQL